MKVERWHRAIKHDEGDGKIIKRLDKSFCLILKALNTKLVNRVITLEKGKMTSKIKDINERHKRSENLNPEYVIEIEEKKKWVVPSEKSIGSAYLETYDVVRKESCACEIRCNDCNICIHEFHCSCPDYAIKFVICKHIHLICRSFMKDIPQELNSGELVIDENDYTHEKEVLETQLVLKAKKQVVNNLESGRSKCLMLLSNLTNKCKSPDLTSDELKIMSDTLKDLDKKLTLSKVGNYLKENSSATFKRKIEKQKRFPLPKSKRSKNE